MDGVQQPPFSYSIAAPVVASATPPPPGCASLSSSPSLLPAANRTTNIKTPNSITSLDVNATAQGLSPVFPSEKYWADSAKRWSLKDFQDFEKIGKGKDTVIYKAFSKSLSKLICLKVYPRHGLSSSKKRAIYREIAMMNFFTQLNIPNIVQFYGSFRDTERVFLIMELCEGGDLLEVLLARKVPFSERRAIQKIAVPLLTSVACVHSLNIIHRDIKLENIFLTADYGEVRLGDMGLTMSKLQENAISPVGTTEYMAPEVIALPTVEVIQSGRVAANCVVPNDNKVDIWAVGVTMYELLTGHLPFHGNDKMEVKANIVENKLIPPPKNLSREVRDFLKQMLAYSADDRPSALMLLTHPAVMMHCPEAATAAAGAVVELSKMTKLLCADAVQAAFNGTTNYNNDGVHVNKIPIPSLLLPAKISLTADATGSTRYQDVAALSNSNTTNDITVKGGVGGRSSSGGGAASPSTPPQQHNGNSGKETPSPQQQQQPRTSSSVIAGWNASCSTPINVSSSTSSFSSSHPLNRQSKLKPTAASSSPPSSPVTAHTAQPLSTTTVATTIIQQLPPPLEMLPTTSSSSSFSAQATNGGSQSFEKGGVANAAATAVPAGEAEDSQDHGGGCISIESSADSLDSKSRKTTDGTAKKGKKKMISDTLKRKTSMLKKMFARKVAVF